MQTLNVKIKTITESELIHEFKNIKDYDMQQLRIEELAKEFNLKHGSITYILRQNEMYIKKGKISEEKKALLDAFGIITGQNMKSMGNMTLTDLKKLWSYIIRENDRSETN